MMMLVASFVFAQSADKLYEEGKALYDAEKYTQAIAQMMAAYTSQRNQPQRKDTRKHSISWVVAMIKDTE